MKIATIGFRTKTGRAIAVALSGSEFVKRWEIDLCDRNDPPTTQPHHEVMELPWAEAQKAVIPIEKKIDEMATRKLAALVGELASAGFQLKAIAVVGSPDRNLEKIGNPHIRAHAAEGILFRRAIEVAAASCGIRCRSFSDREVQGKVTKQLAAIGRAAGRPWRADERAAATAALRAD